MFRRYRIFALVALAAFVFLAYPGRREIVTSHEARVVQVARQMAAAGWPWEGGTITVPAVRLVKTDGISRLTPDLNLPPVHVNPWLVPVMNGEIRLQKPPLPYWCAAVAFKLTGGWSEGRARFVPSLLGALALLPLWGLARRLLGRAGASLSVLIWLSSWFVIREYRVAMADPYLAFFSLVAVWAWVETASRGRVQGGGSRDWEVNPVALPRGFAWDRTGLIVIFWLSLALAVLAKGPVVLVPVPIALVAYRVCWRRPMPRPLAAHLLGIVAFAAIALPWALYVYIRVPQAGEIWRYESIGELSDNVEKARAWWYYIPNLFHISMMWTPVWIVGMVMTTARIYKGRVPLSPVPRGEGRGEGSSVKTGESHSLASYPSSLSAGERDPAARRRRSLFPLAWYVAVVLFFSLLHVKKNAYLLPVIPAQTMIIAQGLTSVLAAARRRNRTVPRLLIGAQAVIGAAFAVGTPFFVIGVHRAIPVLLLCGAAIAFAAIALVAARQAIRRWPCWQGAAYAMTLGIFCNLYLAMHDSQRSARPFCRHLAEMLAAHPGVTLLVPRLPEEAAVYLPVNVTYDPSKERVWVVIDDHRNNVSTNVNDFQRRIADGQVLSVRRIPVPGARDERWKLFEVEVGR